VPALPTPAYGNRGRRGALASPPPRRPSEHGAWSGWIPGSTPWPPCRMAKRSSVQRSWGGICAVCAVSHGASAGRSGDRRAVPRRGPSWHGSMPGSPASIWKPQRCGHGEEPPPCPHGVRYRLRGVQAAAGLQGRAEGRGGHRGRSVLPVLEVVLILRLCDGGDAALRAAAEVSGLRGGPPAGSEAARNLVRSAVSSTVSACGGEGSGDGHGTIVKPAPSKQEVSSEPASA